MRQQFRHALSILRSAEVNRPTTTCFCLQSLERTNANQTAPAGRKRKKSKPDAAQKDILQDYDEEFYDHIFNLPQPHDNNGLSVTEKDSSKSGQFASAAEALQLQLPGDDLFASQLGQAQLENAVRSFSGMSCVYRCPPYL